MAAVLLIGGLTASPLLSREKLDCSAAGTRDVYDTPTGSIESGYFDPVRGAGSSLNATTGLPAIVATVVGKSIFEICSDSKGKQYEFPITTKQLNNFRDSIEVLPTQSL